MDGKRLFIDCNPSKFVVFSSLFMFAILLSLKLGKFNIIEVDYEKLEKIRTYIAYVAPHFFQIKSLPQ